MLKTHKWTCIDSAEICANSDCSDQVRSLCFSQFCWNVVLAADREIVSGIIYKCPEDLCAPVLLLVGGAPLGHVSGVTQAKKPDTRRERILMTGSTCCFDLSRFSFVLCPRTTICIRKCETERFQNFQRVCGEIEVPTEQLVIRETSTCAQLDHQTRGSCFLHQQQLTRVDGLAFHARTIELPITFETGLNGKCSSDCASYRKPTLFQKCHFAISCRFSNVRVATSGNSVNALLKRLDSHQVNPLVAVDLEG